MNDINFLAKDSFSASTNTWDMMKEMIFLASKTALLGGTNYILQGCIEDSEGNVSSGLIVIDGEILPFEGGLKQDRVGIDVTKQTLEAFEEVFREAYIFRKVIFSDNGTYNWNDFKQVLSHQEIDKIIKDIKGESPGFVKSWSGRIDRIPDDYILCDGRRLQTALYPALAYVFGRENEEGFDIPNLKGQFIAGYDNNDPDYEYIGRTGGDKKVKLSIAQMPKHDHSILFKDEKWGDNANSRPFPNPSGGAGYTANTSEEGGSEEHENRPPYYTLAYVIKVK